MEEITFLVQGSAAEPYEVAFRKARDDENLTAHCTCPAGQKRLQCKHRIAILSGEQKWIVSDNLTQVSVVQSWLSGTALEAALTEYESAEAAHTTTQKRLVAAKKKLAGIMLSQHGRQLKKAA